MLHAEAILSWQRTLSAALEAPSGLDDADRIDALRALETLGCVVSAAQAQLSVELDASQRAQQEAGGTPPARAGRGVAAQIAWARRESPHRGQRHLGLAKAVSTELPTYLVRLARGPDHRVEGHSDRPRDRLLEP